MLSPGSPRMLVHLPSIFHSVFVWYSNSHAPIVASIIQLHRNVGCSPARIGSPVKKSVTCNTFRVALEKQPSATPWITLRDHTHSCFKHLVLHRTV